MHLSCQCCAGRCCVCWGAGSATILGSNHCLLVAGGELEGWGSREKLFKLNLSFFAFILRNEWGKERKRIQMWPQGSRFQKHPQEPGERQKTLSSLHFSLPILFFGDYFSLMLQRDAKLKATSSETLLLPNTVPCQYVPPCALCLGVGAINCPEKGLCRRNQGQEGTGVLSSNPAVTRRRMQPGGRCATHPRSHLSQWLLKIGLFPLENFSWKPTQPQAVLRFLKCFLERLPWFWFQAKVSSVFGNSKWKALPIKQHLGFLSSSGREKQERNRYFIKEENSHKSPNASQEKKKTNTKNNNILDWGFHEPLL